MPDTNNTKTMLPVFPKARKAMAETFSHFMFEAMWNESPVLRKIPTSPQLEGSTATYERVTGGIRNVEYKTMAVERKMKFTYGEGLDPVVFWEAASSIGREMARQMTDGMLSSVSQAVEEVGNVKAISSGKITFEDFVDLNLTMHVDFDDQGCPVDRVLVAGPDVCKAFETNMRAWQDDPDKSKLLTALTLRKKLEHDEREARRRMVD